MASHVERYAETPKSSPYVVLGTDVTFLCFWWYWTKVTAIEQGDSSIAPEHVRDPCNLGIAWGRNFSTYNWRSYDQHLSEESYLIVNQINHPIMR